MAFETFTVETFRRAVTGHGVVMVIFSSPDCPPCESMERNLFAVAQDPWQGIDLPSTSLQLGRINVDAYPALADAQAIRKTPTLKVYQNGALVFQHVGVLPELMLRSLIRNLAAA